MLDAVDPELLPVLAERLRALADPLRLRLLQSLGEQERTVTELVEMVGTTQPNVSRHIARLERAGFVRRRRLGGNVLVRIDEQAGCVLCEQICALVRRQAAEAAAVAGVREERNER